MNYLTMRYNVNQTHLCFMSALIICITSELLQMSHSSIVDSFLFVRLRNFDGYLHTNYTLMSLTPIRSKLDCARVCMQNPECGSFFYLDEPKNLCQTHSVLFATTDEAGNSSKASYYQLTQSRCPHERGFILYRPVPLCYRYVQISLNTSTAQSMCQKTDNHLIDIKSAEISNHIINFLMASSTLREMSVSIGGQLVNQSLYWSDGTPAMWTNFQEGEPNGLDNIMCIALLYDYGFKFDDHFCEEIKEAYICQLDI